MRTLFSRWPLTSGLSSVWWLADGLLWAVLVAPMAYARLSPPHERHAFLLLLGTALLLALAVRSSRRLPLLSVVLVLAGSAFDGNFVFALLFFSYLAGRRDAGTVPAVVLFTVVAVGGTAWHLTVLDTGPATLFLLNCALLLGGVFPWLVGRYRRQQDALLTAGWAHADAVEREQRGCAERVRLRERARIAEEMHDSLGHELSLIALRASALEVASDLTERHRAAAGELRASVAGATERLHEIIGVLRAADHVATGSVGEHVATAPAAEQLADLVERAREAGMVVEAHLDPVELPPLVAQAANRVVREALTNAARYAPGAAVQVTVAPDTVGRIAVRVVNDRPPTGPLANSSRGSGLLAVAERIRLLGGTFTAGPAADGGFAVAARLPVHATVVALAPGSSWPDHADTPADLWDTAARETVRAGQGIRDTPTVTSRWPGRPGDSASSTVD